VNVDFFHVKVLWHDSHPCLNSPLCGSAWQDEQAENGMPVYRGWSSAPAAWHFRQGVVRCAPVSANRVFEWSKFCRSIFAAFQSTVEWHCVQLGPNRPWCLSSWQVTQPGERPNQVWFRSLDANKLRADGGMCCALWQERQLTPMCFPSSTYPVFAWSKPLGVGSQ